MANTLTGGLVEWTMRATIMAARVLGVVLLLWAALTAAWGAATVNDDPSLIAADVRANAYFSTFTIAMAIAGLGLLLLLTAGILEELRRRDN